MPRRNIGQGPIMRALRLRHWSVTIFLLLFASAVPVIAREISAQEAAAQAQQETGGGKVLSVQTLHVGQRKVYRIKLLTRDGEVRIVQVAADQ